MSNVLLGLGLPLFTGLFVITAMALYEPAMQWVMEFGASPRTVARERLLRAMGRPLITVQPASAGVGPALERVATVLDVVGIAAIATNGEVIAAYGSPGPGARAVPLQVDDEVVGELRVGATRSGAELSDQDQAVLRLSAAYVANALRTGGREEAQVDSLVGLAAERELVEVQASELHEALVRGGAGPRCACTPWGRCAWSATARRSSAGAATRPVPARPRRSSRSCSTAASAA